MGLIAKTCKKFTDCSNGSLFISERGNAKGGIRLMGYKRIYVAVIFIPLFYVLVKYSPAWAFSLFAAGGIILGLYEFYWMHYRDGRNAKILIGLIAGSILMLLFYQQAWVMQHGWVTGLVMMILLVQLFLKKNIKTIVPDGAVILVGLFYVAWLLGHLILLRHLRGGEYLVFFVFWVTWSCDAGAYYVGRQWGRHALAPQVSPNKTIEGAIGGMVWGLFASLLARWWFLPDLSLQDAISLGLCLAGLGQLGDLTESLFKRGASVKDSGRLFPGHGGLLDKVDSLIFTAPAFYYYLVWVKHY